MELLIVYDVVGKHVNICIRIMQKERVRNVWALPCCPKPWIWNTYSFVVTIRWCSNCGQHIGYWLINGYAQNIKKKSFIVLHTYRAHSIHNFCFHKYLIALCTCPYTLLLDHSRRTNCERRSERKENTAIQLFFCWPNYTE